MACLCLLISLQACKKDKINKNQLEKPQLPPDTEDGSVVSGIIQGPGSADIIYRKVNAVVAYNKHLALDVDADGAADFSFNSVLIQHNDKPHLYLLVSPKTAKVAKVMVQQGEELVVNALWSFPLEKDILIQAAPASNCIWTEPLMKGFVISSSKTSANEAYEGLWLGKSNKFLGIQFKLPDGVHYGWVKLSHVASTDEITIVDYAYNKIPAQAMAAGRTE